MQHEPTRERPGLDRDAKLTDAEILARGMKIGMKIGMVALFLARAIRNCDRMLRRLRNS